MDNKVIIFDTTLRDGEQAPGFSMNIEDKLKMARQLERLNVDILEAGFPIASEGDFEAVRRVSKEVRTPTIAAPSLSTPSCHELRTTTRTVPVPSNTPTNPAFMSSSPQAIST